ncbi:MULTISPECIES: hypothetical protein [unclassified Variovorax]|uniref:hypothetical protein n=1 Tax=unclassified Variovorax TaxID=663243 RepID=UPI002B23CE30|nr:hypothetical protein [Variovorax sp. LG9.2]MEB0057747.1 hypothetical protein [Variovorax sp. LG9.2]
MPARYRIGWLMALLAGVSASLGVPMLAGCAGVGVAGGSGQGLGVGLSLSPDALFRRSSPAGAVASPPRIEGSVATPVPAIVETYESAPPASTR